MFATFFQRALLAILALSQVTLGALPPKIHDGRYVRISESGVTGVYPGFGRGITDREVVQLLIESGLEGRSLARAQLLPVPATFAVYLNTGGDLVIGASGAGTKQDAEPNIQATCLREGIPFQGGRIVNYNFENYYFIKSCKDCKLILDANGPIRDVRTNFERHGQLAVDIIRDMGPTLST